MLVLLRLQFSSFETIVKRVDRESHDCAKMSLKPSYKTRFQPFRFIFIIVSFLTKGYKQSGVLPLNAK
jgi:hypothetical protein